MRRRLYGLALILLLATLLSACTDAATKGPTDTGGGFASTPSAESTAPEGGSTGEVVPEQTASSSETEPSGGEGTGQETTPPGEDIDLPKVEF